MVCCSGVCIGFIAAVLFYSRLVLSPLQAKAEWYVAGQGRISPTPSGMSEGPARSPAWMRPIST